jgi:hypothetical protein
MKILIIYLSVFAFACNANKPNKSMSKTKEADFSDSIKYHFQILDSAVKANPQDTIYHCCTPSIKFMEINTSIESKADGTLFGKLYFSKDEWKKWHHWYENNTGKKESQIHQ